MHGSASYGALDSLIGFVHGDAIDMEMTLLFVCAKGDALDIYKAVHRTLVPGERRGRRSVTHGYPLPISKEFRDDPQSLPANSVPNGPLYQS
jgi:hypothetical protein